MPTYPKFLVAVYLTLASLPLLAGERKATTELLETADSFLVFSIGAPKAAAADGLAPWEEDEFVAEGAIKLEAWKEAHLARVVRPLLDDSRVPSEFATPARLRERAATGWLIAAEEALFRNRNDDFRTALSSLLIADPGYTQLAADLAREWNNQQNVSVLRRLPQAKQVERLIKESPDEFAMQSRREKLRLDERHDDELVLRAWSENGWWHDPEIQDLKSRLQRRQADTDTTLALTGLAHLITAYEAGSNGDADALRSSLEKLQGSPLNQGWIYMSLERELAAMDARLARIIPMERTWQTADGTTTTLQQVLGDGKALLLDFYASWCQPCMAAMPALADRAKRFAPKGLVVVGMNVEGDPAKARAVRKKFELTLPWLMDANDDTGLASLLEIDAIPFTALVSKEGKLLYLGAPESPVLDAKLDAL